MKVSMGYDGHYSGPFRSRMVKYATYTVYLWILALTASK